MPSTLPKLKKESCRCAKTSFRGAYKCVFTRPKTCTPNSIYAYRKIIANTAMVGLLWVHPISLIQVWASSSRHNTNSMWQWKTMTMSSIAPMSSGHYGMKLFLWPQKILKSTRRKHIWAINLLHTNYISKCLLILLATKLKTISPSSCPMVSRIWNTRKMPLFKVIRCWCSITDCSLPMW